MGVSLPTGTVTFLFSDVEGSTRLWERHPEQMQSALAVHDKIMRSAIGEAGGYVFSTAGDAYSAAFERPVQALEAAMEAQDHLTELDDEDIPIRVRMAVHTGTADERDGDYFGPALNRAARLLSVGNGRQILVSLATAELTHDSLPDGTTLDDLGQHRLKDLSRPEQVYRLRKDSLPVDTRPLRSLDAFPHNLPIQLTSFVGREDEVAEVAKLLSGSRMVTLAGVGGAGKTRLAVQTAAEALSNYDNGVWLVELAPVTDADQVVPTVMDVLGIEEKPTEDPMDTTVKWLSDKEILLILDNCEHIVDPAARLAARALGADTGVSILATSREMLGVPGEYPYQVKSLASPTSVDEAIRSAVIRYPAVRLFAERGELARPGWRITSENAEDVVQICQRLDGMPLAIELAAARLRMMRTEQIAERLDDRFRLLTGGSRTVLPRQQTLEAAIDWSFDLLSDEERVLFRRLAVFMGGFTLESAESVCGVDPLDELSVFDHVGHLVDKSLVQAEERPDGIRYGMLETLRQYARQKLAESDEIEAMRRRHAEHFLDLTEQAEPELRGENEDYWFRRLDDELDNLRQAMSWALEAPEPQLAQAIAGGLYRYFMYRFRTVEGRQWAERAVEASEEPTWSRAKALLAAGTLAQISLDNDVSMRCLDQALELSRTLGANDILSPALNNRANIASALGMWEQAEKLHGENLELARTHNAKDVIVISLINLTFRALDREDVPLAISRAQEAVDIAIDLGSDRLTDDGRFFLLQAYRRSGDLDAASAVLDRMIAHEEELGFELAPGRTQALQAALAMDRGAFTSAVPLFQEALRRFRGVPEPYDFGLVVQWMLWQGARLLNHQEKSDVSASLLGVAQASLEAKGYIRSPSEAAQIEVVLADARDALGDQAFESAYRQGQKLEPREALDRLATTLDDLS